MDIKKTRTQWYQETCLALKPIIGNQADQFWQAYLVQDEEGKRDMEEQLELLANYHLHTDVQNKTPVFHPPTSEQAQGEFELGNIFYNNEPSCPFALRSKELFQHIAIFGRSGGGKTNTGFIFVKSLRDNNIPFILFDWKKNYRDLVKLSKFRDLRAYPIGQKSSFSFNPLIPPQGVDPKSYLQKIIAVMGEAYFLGEGSVYLLQATIDALYRQYGVYDQSVQNWPTFRDVLRSLRRVPIKGGRESLWLSSALRTIASLCFGQADRIFNAKSNQSLEDIMSSSTVFEMEALAQQEKVMFVQSIAQWIHMRELAMGGKRETLKRMLIVEEAQHVFSKRSRSNTTTGDTPLTIAMRELREFGIGICLIAQHPSEIALAALGNTYTTICMNLKSAQDVQTASSSMLLNNEQKLWLGRMPIGRAVVKLQGRISEPFMIHIPEFTAIRKGSVSDEDILKRLGLAKASSIRESRTSTETRMPSAIDGTTAILRDIQQHPEGGVAARYKRLGISARQGDKLKKELLTKHLVSEFDDITTKGRTKRLKLTSAGTAKLGSNPDP